MTWFKDGRPLPAATRYTTDYDLSTLVASLKIENAQMNDVGHYLVVAENDAGRDQTHAQVFVTQTASIDQSPMVNPDAFKYLEQQPHKARPEEVEKMVPPKIIVPLSNVKLEEGQSIFLACKVDGQPKPKVRRKHIFFI